MRSRDGIADFIRLVWTGTRGAFAKAAILQTLGSLSEIVSILLLIPLLRLLDPSRNEILIDLNRLPLVTSDHVVAITLPMIIGAFVAATILRSLLLETKERYNARVMFGFVADFQHQLFKAVTLTRWQVLGRYRTADLTQVLTSNIDRLLMATHQLLQLVQSALMTVIFALASLAISWRMTLAAIVIGVGVFAFTYRARRRSFEHGQTVGRQRRDEFRLVDGFLGGLRTAKLFGLQQQHLSAMDDVLARIYQHNVQFASARARSATIYQTLTAVAVASFIFVALTFQTLELPVLLAMLFLFMRLAPRIMSLHSVSQELAASLGPVSAVVQLLQACRENAEQPVQAAGGRDIGLDRGIELSQIEFRYGPEDAPTLDRVSAFIPAHAITAISGPSGSGKSTLLDIISGLLPPGSGKMMVDGLALDDELMPQWQQHVALVPQETFLFNDTIAANLRLADESIDDAQLWRALELADAAELVRAKPAGLETSVGDRGQALSGGERQRIAIARAVLRRPRLLILDEATSALDAASEARVVEAIRSLRGETTIVIVTHRPALLDAADYVIALEDGKATSSPLAWEIMDGGKIAI
jgi:ATP-binding cassette subfamily C protein